MVFMLLIHLYENENLSLFYVASSWNEWDSNMQKKSQLK